MFGHVCRHYRCDMDPDCEDATDEVDCPSINCEENQFRCNDHECIPRSWVCDSTDDCSNGSDELDCDYAGNAVNLTAHADDDDRCRIVNKVGCGDGTCIPRSFFCGSYKLDP